MKDRVNDHEECLKILTARIIVIEAAIEDIQKVISRLVDALSKKPTTYKENVAETPREF